VKGRTPEGAILLHSNSMTVGQQLTDPLLPPSCPGLFPSPNAPLQAMRPLNSTTSPYSAALASYFMLIVLSKQVNTFKFNCKVLEDQGLAYYCFMFF
jgi:hypothetical protein